ncbi:replication region DNA-binding N-term [Duganella sacchari]|uniref:Replication region DNA-binding N-term n=1 Tax=Duganella sacchari TaxID=551987 RepID=A0A1M7KSN1_9BURK|nr:DNA-binding protein [Duganella sacchari]SHM68469.1 replication region DNA-binding N-term [Duganella sacchari]
MARAGVLYSHVAKAAAQLAAAGKNPTVDTVREAMGGTGSKSTIAPMLKQWKAQHEGEVAAAGAGLPADLLEAVQAVYQRVQEGAKAQIEHLRAEHNHAEQEAARAVEALHAEWRQLGAEREALAGELANVKATLARDQAARQKDAVAIATLESEKDGQAQRLADRAAEVRELAEQLAQARRQFEHFQDASATQRQEDKSAYEARIARTEQEAATLRTYLQDSREALAVLRSEKVHLEHTLAEQLDAAREQARKLYEATAALTAAREMASSRQFEMEMAEERLDHAQQANVRLEARLTELESENVLLKAKAMVSVPKARGRKT